MDQLVSDLGQIVGPSHVLTGTDMARYSSDWLHQYQWQPQAIIRPATAEQVSEVVKLANRMKIPLVPMGGIRALPGAPAARRRLFCRSSGWLLFVKFGASQKWQSLKRV